MLSCAGADRLQTGMRGAFGKPMGKAARVYIGKILISVRCRDRDVKNVMECLRRGKNKFAGRMKIVTSQKWGFTQFGKAEFQRLKDAGKIVPAGDHVKLVSEHGPLSRLPLF